MLFLLLLRVMVLVVVSVAKDKTFRDVLASILRQTSFCSSGASTDSVSGKQERAFCVHPRW